MSPSEKQPPVVSSLSELDKEDTEKYIRGQGNFFTDVLFSKKARRRRQQNQRSEQPSDDPEKQTSSAEAAPATKPVNYLVPSPDSLDVDPDEKPARPISDKVKGAARGWWKGIKVMTGSRRAIGETVRQAVPITKWLPEYNWRTTVLGDLAGAVTVTMMVLPQSIAYASLAQLPAQYGLYSSIVPQFLYAIFGTSPHISVGPVALNSLLYYTQLSAMGYDRFGNFNDYLQGVFTLTLYTGIATMFCGIFRLGKIVSYISPAVMTGFTTAYVVLAGIPQLQPILGYKIQEKNITTVEELILTIKNIGNTDPRPLIFGLVTLAIVMGLRKISPRAPGAMIAIFLTTLVSWMFSMWAPHLVPAVVGNVPAGLPSIVMPSLASPHTGEMISSAFVLTLLGYMQSTAAAKKYSDLYGSNFKPNQDLIALGICGIGGSFFQGIQPTGAFSRTAVAVDSGTRSQISSIICACLVIVSLVSITPAFWFITSASLAAVILAATFPLVDPAAHIRLWKINPTEGFVALLTTVVTIFTTVPLGMGVGIVASALMPVVRSARPRVSLLGRLKSPRDGVWKEMKRHREAVGPAAGIRVVRLDAELSFANAGFLEEALIRAADGIHPIVDPDDSDDFDDDNVSDDMEIELTAVGTHVYDEEKAIQERADRKAKLLEEESSIAETPHFEIVRASYIVLDLSASNEVDVAGAAALVTIANELLANHECVLLLASVRHSVRRTLRRSWTAAVDDDVERQLLSRCFLNIDKAVEYASESIEASKALIARPLKSAPLSASASASASAPSPASSSSSSSSSTRALPMSAASLSSPSGSSTSVVPVYRSVENSSSATDDVDLER